MIERIAEIEKTLKGFFKDRTEVIFAYIFGSMVSDKNTELSDIDIAVYINEKELNESNYRYGYKADLIANLMSILNTNKIDLAILNNAPLLLKNRVVSKGQLIFTRDKKKSFDYKLRVREKYLDYQVTEVK